MKLLIDLQGCQTASRSRGIGRYSLALTKAIARNRGTNRVILLANSSFSEGLAELRAAFSGEIPAQDFVVFDADFPVAESDAANVIRTRFSELVRERLINDIAPDAVLLTSLFEGFLDDAVTSVGAIGRKPLTAVTLYDLIPHLSPDPNWPPEYNAHYRRKIISLKRADLLLSISDYARRETSEAIPELAPRIAVMSSACDSMFCPGVLREQRVADLKLRYQIRGLFVMSSGILEPRKNYEFLLQAFATLPSPIATVRQIVLVGSGEDAYIAALRRLACELGFSKDQLIITGHVPDEDLRDLYRSCELFVFPSKHEGFGLPPLEAMACGAAVIGSRATSVPEVIGRQTALFDLTSIQSLSELMLKTLTDSSFCASLKAEGLDQSKAFSWDKCATHALRAIADRLMEPRGVMDAATDEVLDAKPHLAMVSPLPPEQTGIADYVAELIPELSRHYEVTVVSDQSTVTLGRDGLTINVETIAWFEKNAGLFDRVVYQVGNSPFHAHMPDLLARYPGVVVLHDFFLSSMMEWMEVSGFQPKAFRDALLESHGYLALAQLESEGAQAAKERWPCSFDLVHGASELIVHSQYARQLISSHYGDEEASNATVIRLHRRPDTRKDKAIARSRLGIAKNAFLVCAFGILHSSKLNHRLLEAWAASRLASDQLCQLVFVGGDGEPGYSADVSNIIKSIHGGARISVSGFASRDVYEDYLCAADAAVQLRALSRGETSGTVLDCLAHGVPVVINAHGSMKEYPDDVVIKLSDRFDSQELTSALEDLRTDVELRQRLSARGPVYLNEMHAPEVSAQGYMEVIERSQARTSFHVASRAASHFWTGVPAQVLEERCRVSRKIASTVNELRRRMIYLDLSATVRNDLKTGIERVARSLLREMVLAPPEGYVVVPVYLSEEGGRWRVRRANRYLSRQPGFAMVPSEDELVVPMRGDFLMALDLFSEGVVAATKAGHYDYWRSVGARIGFLVYDLLPISRPHLFPSWAPAAHEDWIHSIHSASDLLVCISKHVESELKLWLGQRGVDSSDGPRIVTSSLGADIEASLPTKGLPANVPQILEKLAAHPTFLMVGTIEPRKGHLQVIHAFRELWSAGVEVNLVIVGYEGWKPLADEDRRTIPEIVRLIKNAPNLGETLFWLEGISDEYLDLVYGASRCLIAASVDEGFGLPLIEGSRHGLPILARDIPVFREVGGDAVEFFTADEPAGLAMVIARKLETMNRAEAGSNSAGIPWFSWKESAAMLAAQIIEVAAEAQ